MKKIIYLMAAAGLAVSFTACNQGGSNNGKSADSTAMDTIPPLSIVPVTGSPEFPDASLSIKQIKTDKAGDSAKLAIDYNVQHYELTSQTADAAGKQCNNSAQGQHIHFILDNGPYTALYKPHHEIMLPLNSEHYILSFLSRSYHESLKNPGAAVLLHFKIDGNGRLQKLDIPSSPQLFYSRPKGAYIGDDTKNVLLDFYVYNGHLGDSLKVKADINDTTFVISQWQPYFIEHAPMGDLKVKLSLVGQDGTTLEGPNTSVERTATLATDEPLAK